MKFQKKILVVNRITLVMGDDLIEKWGASATEDRVSTAYATSVIFARLQQRVNQALLGRNPDLCTRADVCWTESSMIAVGGLFVIASVADDEVLKHFEDCEYLDHLAIIKEVAEESGFVMTVQKVVANFPFANTEIPASFKVTNM